MQVEERRRFRSPQDRQPLKNNNFLVRSAFNGKRNDIFLLRCPETVGKLRMSVSRLFIHFLNYYYYTRT